MEISFKRKAAVYSVCFLIPFLFLLGIAALSGMEPFGNVVPMLGDMGVQYVPFFSLFRDTVRTAGNAFYSFRLGLGGDFWTLFCYYLSSPLNLLLAAVPEDMLLPCSYLLIYLKVSLCGLTMAFYFGRHSAKPGAGLIAVSLAWSFSSFMLGYCFNIIWLDTLALFPLVLAGMERMLSGKSGAPYCIALFWSMWCNFYMALIVCIFCVFWFVFTEIRNDGISRMDFLRFVGWSVLAAGMACVILLPSAYSILVAGGAMRLDMDYDGFGNPARILYKLLTPCDICNISHDAWDVNLYGGPALLPFAVLYFADREIPERERIAAGVLCGFLCAALCVPVLNFIMHGFCMQNLVPNRFSFLLVFLLIFMSARMMENRGGIRKQWIAVSVVVCAAACAVSMVYSVLSDGDTGFAVIGSCFSIGMLFLFVRERNDGEMAFFWRGMISATVVFAMLLHCFCFFETWPTMYFTDGDLMKADEEVRILYNGNVENWPLMAGYGNPSFFSSTMTDAYRSFFCYFTSAGMNYVSMRQMTPFMCTLFDIKYSVHIGNNSDNDGISGGQSDNVRVFEDTDAYGSAPGYLIYSDISSFGFGDEDWENEPRMAECLTGIFTSSVMTGWEDGIEEESVSGDEMIVYTVECAEECRDLWIECMPDGGQYYMTVRLNGEEVISGWDNCRLVDIGSISKGDTLEIVLQDIGEGIEFADSMSFGFINVDPDAEAQACSALADVAWEPDVLENGHIAGTADMKEDGYLLLSVPCDAGWTVFVDGIETEPYAFADFMLSVPLEAGEHEIEMSYVTPGFYPGLAVSLCSCGIFIIFSAVPYLRRRRSVK